MSHASTHPFDLAEPRSSAQMFDKFILIPILIWAYVEIVAPLLLHAAMGPRLGGMWTNSQMEIVFQPHIEHKIFWPFMALVTVILVIRNWSRLAFPPHIISLFVHLTLAGVSVLWAFKPEFTVVRAAQQAMIIISVVLPPLLAARSADLMRGVFLCLSAALILNIPYVWDQPPLILENGRLCYSGYFVFKSDLGQCATVALLLSFYEILFPGWRRRFGIIMIGVASYLMILSDSKGSLGLALLAPLLSAFTLFLGKVMRVSPAIVLMPIPFIYAIASRIVGNLINRISWHVFGNYDLSGRVLIWDFASFEIDRRPWLGWGYQSFWLVGPDSPSIVDAPGWVRDMPNSHNGYLDTMVDMGLLGITTLVIFIFTTLHAIGRVRESDPGKAWVLLTLALFIILINFLETGWMHGMDVLWLVFLLVVAETGRYWLPVRQGSAVAGNSAIQHA